jgi:hypothetical protein
VYELCVQLEIALEYIASERNIPIDSSPPPAVTAFNLFRTQFLDTLEGTPGEGETCSTEIVKQQEPYLTVSEKG